MNKFVHVELNTDDVKAAKKFYKGLFDWQLQDVSLGLTAYTTINTGKPGEGGGMTEKRFGTPTEWVPYVQVESVKRTIAKAEKRGAQIIVEYRPIPGMGALGIFVDPSGAKLGIWEAEMPAKKPAAKKKKK